jgi:hypothetical protein
MDVLHDLSLCVAKIDIHKYITETLYGESNNRHFVQIPYFFVQSQLACFVDTEVGDTLIIFDVAGNKRQVVVNDSSSNIEVWIGNE